MRWYGPNDTVPLAYIKQAGSTGIVSALHDVAIGHVWEVADIMERKAIIEKAGLTWSVVESVNVHESIKVAASDRDQYIDWYRQTLQNLAKCDIRTICYNFMPVLDWSRTDLVYPMKDGSKALRFERIALVAFDLYILERDGAEKDYDATDIARAKVFLDGLDRDARQLLQENVTMGLPGGARGYTLEEVRERLATYDDIDATVLKANLKYFLKQIMEVAEEENIKLAIHPDDPPYPLLGLPRVVSTEADAVELLTSVPSPSNGLCFCTGSYGVRSDNDLPGMAERLGEHINFIHLRNVKSEDDGNFYEADHLDGNTDMYGVMKAICLEQQKRVSPIPMRPDHGHAMLDDLEKVTNPGYTAIGRLRGQAELRGLEYGILRGLEA
ncbi:UNVERIFIED_CONTAM: hypothetical protein GTU68_028353 [Idotea baltica]|nr:hypothetical protein [Idotea baltica]